MSKFNKVRSVKEIVSAHPDKVWNEAGGVSFNLSPKLKLLSIIGSAMMSENKYYQTGKEADGDLTKAIDAVLEDDPAFVLKAAYWARTSLYMRSVPLYMIARYANSNKVGVPNSRKYVTATIQRADEITELLAIQQVMSERSGRKSKWPMVIKNGVKDAFNKFDAYQFAKYNRPGLVTMKDAIFITHPKAKDSAQQEIFDKIVEDTLEAPDTWEVLISTKGSNKETWSEIAPRLPYFALIRNLRNLMNNDVDPELYINNIADPERVARSKMFPFRFFSANKELSANSVFDSTPSRITRELNKALELSVGNVPKLPGRTAVLVDLSGSMTSPVSVKSSTSCLDIATLFGALSTKVCGNATVIPFGQSFAVVPLTTSDSVLTQCGQIKSANVGHSTNAHLPVEQMIRDNAKFDRIILFSDMQCWDSSGWYSSGNFAESFINYQRKVNQNVKLYSVDLRGYGTTTVPEDQPNVATISGWSDKIFNYISMFEVDDHTIVHEVEALSV